MTEQQRAVAEVLAWRPPDGREWTDDAVADELARRDAPVRAHLTVLGNMRSAGLVWYGPDGWALTAAGSVERGG